MNAEVAHLVEAWHWMYFEIDLVFGGLSEENLHRRPAPNLLSVSEHAAHVARSEASIVYRYMFGLPPEAWADHLLLQAEFGWPPSMLEKPVNPELARYSVQQVREEWETQHQRCYARSRTLTLDAGHEFADDWDRIRTVRDRLRIAAYHVGYHMGQIYTVRHLLGEETPEN